jgi:hypothetical protein
MFRREALTRIVIIPFGNALGVLLFGLLASPVLVSSALGGRAKWGAVLIPIASLAAGIIDVRTRGRSPDPSPMVRWFSPYEGGNLVFIPSWLVSVAFLALFAFAVVR